MWVEINYGTDKAEACFVNGDIVYIRTLTLEGMPALGEVVQWRVGYFRITALEVNEGPPRINIQGPTMGLLLEASQMADESGTTVHKPLEKINPFLPTEELTPPLELSQSRSTLSLSEFKEPPKKEDPRQTQAMPALNSGMRTQKMPVFKPGQTQQMPAIKPVQPTAKPHLSEPVTPETPKSRPPIHSHMPLKPKPNRKSYPKPLANQVEKTLCLWEL